MGGPSGSSSETRNNVDPWTSSFNQLKYGELLSGLNEGFNLKNMLRQNPYALPTGRESEIYKQMSGWLGGPTPEMEQYDREGIETLKGLADPNARLGEARNLFEQYQAPTISNYATASGLGRTGAVPEALATGFSNMTLPILQDSAESGRMLGQAQLGMADKLESRRRGRAESSLRGASAEREAYSREYMRPFETIMSLLTGTNMQTQNYGSTTSSSGPGQDYTGAAIGAGTSIIAALIPLLASFCWVSVATVGPGNAIWARAYWNTRSPLLRGLYRLLGPFTGRLADRSPLVRRLLTPMAQRWVRKGRALMGC